MKINQMVLHPHERSEGAEVEKIAQPIAEHTRAMNLLN
jgi:hypothetical protein